MNKNILYRNDLLKTAYTTGGHKFREFYAATGIAPGTQRKALNGKLNQLDKLNQFAEAVGVEWSALFQFEGK